MRSTSDEMGSEQETARWIPGERVEGAIATGTLLRPSSAPG